MALLVYCLLAGMVPVWMILQPRGQLGGYFLYFALGAGAIGLILGGGQAQYPAFRGWEASLPRPECRCSCCCRCCSSRSPAARAPGFHSLIASGTTSKQLKNETDAKVVGYGTMLMEAMVAIVSLCCVMMFAEGADAALRARPTRFTPRHRAVPGGRESAAGHRHVVRADGVRHVRL